MDTTQLFRWAGLATLLSGILLPMGFVLHPPELAAEMDTVQWSLVHLLMLLSAMAGILGFTGLYGRHAGQMGKLGLVGFVLFYIAHPLFAGLMFFEAFIVPSLSIVTPEFVEGFATGEASGAFNVVLPLMGLLYSLGGLLFGLAIFRAKILPRWATTMTILGAVPFGIQPALPGFVGVLSVLALGIGLIGLGYALWTEKSTSPTFNHAVLQA
ncbi:MAG: hypothetical protein Fur0022_42650 [Anaerolineales bacterium]